MDERYPIGDTDSVGVAVIRHERREPGYPMWSAAIATRGGEATVHGPGHYPGVLAQRLRQADERWLPGAKLPAGRDDLAESFAAAHANSVGRWRGDLTPEQLADVEAEAGDLLAELGYA